MNEQAAAALKSRPLESLGQLLKLVLFTVNSLTSFIISESEILEKAKELPIPLEVVVNLKKDVIFSFVWSDADKVLSTFLKNSTEAASFVNLESLRGTHRFIHELSKAGKDVPLEPYLPLAINALENLKTAISFGNLE